MQEKIKTSLFYGSETGNTKSHAYEIQHKLKGSILELEKYPFDFADVDIGKILNYDLVIIGSSTWNIGELQADIEAIFYELDNLDLTNKIFALYGSGDQESYPDTYQDALGILGNKLKERGGKLLGFTPIDGHQFESSRGIEKNQFMGLALDDDNQSELNLSRIENWINQLLIEVKEIKLLKGNYEYKN